ncbi:MAG TPA: hypothetical protein VFR99_06505 [Marmoricola sp.]|nr:hypothetical protein [Marmoricola sp.]
MPESPEELYARIVAQVGEGGRLPMPPVQEWEMFPWEVVDGELVPKVVRPPVETEEPRFGESPDKPCGACSGEDRTSRAIWENDRWYVTSFAEPGGMPLICLLQSRQHLDFPDLDDEMAAEYGRLSARLCRIMSNLPHVGRVHVCRWGDGGSHLHVWFIARPARLPGIVGSLAVEWDEMLPPPPEDVWRRDLATVAERLANHDGRALALLS